MAHHFYHPSIRIQQSFSFAFAIVVVVVVVIAIGAHRRISHHFFSLLSLCVNSSHMFNIGKSISALHFYGIQKCLRRKRQCFFCSCLRSFFIPYLASISTFDGFRLFAFLNRRIATTSAWFAYRHSHHTTQNYTRSNSMVFFVFSYQNIQQSHNVSAHFHQWWGYQMDQFGSIYFCIRIFFWHFLL